MMSGAPIPPQVQDQCTVAMQGAGVAKTPWISGVPALKHLLYLEVSVW